MVVYLVYGLDKDDICDYQYVQRVFDTYEKALAYINPINATKSDYEDFYKIEPIEVE